MKTIRDSRARILLVALGAPRQECWIADHLDQFGPILALGVGAGLDFLAGYQRRAPAWFQDRGLEWLYRLIMNPRRLWRRYLIEDSRFLIWLAAGLLRRWWKSTLFPEY